MSQPTAAEYFAARLANETDCADVFRWLREEPDTIVVLDVRSRDAFDGGHLPGAVSLPYQQITTEALDALGHDVTFVTYCWGPHCNGATKGAAVVAQLGRPVKEMLGGVWGWGQEGYDLAVSEASRS